jgi:hypothetical protein
MCEDSGNDKVYATLQPLAIFCEPLRANMAYPPFIVI